MPEKAAPKISDSEMVLVGMFVGTLDAIDFIPGGGDFTDIPGAGLFFYYYKKHINGIVYIIAEILDAIPFVGMIPWRSGVWWGTVAFDRFAPAKVEQTVEELGEKAEGKEGGAGLEGEAGLEEGVAQGVQGGAEEGLESASSPQGGVVSDENIEGESEAVRKKEEENREENEESGSYDGQRRGDENEEAEGGGGEEGESEGESAAERAMESGSEISPEEEAETEDFTLSDTPAFTNTDEDEEEPAPQAKNRNPIKVEDIKSDHPEGKSGAPSSG